MAGEPHRLLGGKPHAAAMELFISRVAMRLRASVGPKAVLVQSHKAEPFGTRLHRPFYYAFDGDRLVGVSSG
jgi:hypothetical protein